MKITYDASVDAAYLKLKSEQDQTPFGFTYCCDPAEVDGQIHLDFDEEGRLIGVEVLNAKDKLPKNLVESETS